MFRSLVLEVSFAAKADTQENVLAWLIWLIQSHRWPFKIDVGANSGKYGRVLRSLGWIPHERFRQVRRSLRAGPHEN